ncbi:Kinase A inhibitor [Candidatus Terasakiella magnetica]|uniref:Kinase A inhibitor n=1 Tax=Candidatus Terasakiella magnetica TaxID=1867952 RepID=A0A1C3RHU6_9PROT|nr:5-oxoprolinase subunit PxpB [Candidatus Terasakiella magnetica]SCA56851.1 Kinase A inhibitor [Candidatus Terasakiella magnetica]
MQCRVLHLGDRGVTFEFGNEISKAVNHHVLAIHSLMKEALAQGQLNGIIETVPSFRSLTIHYDPLVLYPDEVEGLVAPFLDQDFSARESGKLWEFPCCYEGEFAPDLEEVAKSCGLSVSEVINIHSAQCYDVFMLGFLPGFGFLGQLDPRLVLPRRSEPRTAVPKGSVAIADQLTAVYPSQSPGGWHLIGRTHIEFFDLSKENPALLQAGDQVRFKPVSQSEFLRLTGEAS